MRRALSIGLALALLAATASTALAARRAPLVDLAIRDADVRTVLLFLAEQAGTSVVVTPGVRGQVTLYLQRITAEAALRAVAWRHDAVVLPRAGGFVVMTRAERDGAR